MDGRRDPAMRLTRLYVPALGLVALATIGTQLLMQGQLRDQTDVAQVINVAGRQRMLSQRIARNSLLLSMRRDADALRTLKSDLDAVVSGHLRLAREPETTFAELRTPEIARALDEAEIPLSRMVGAARAMARDEPHPGGERGVLAEDADYLARMEDVVGLLQNEARDRVVAARRWEVALCLLALLIIAAEAVFVFRPLARELRGYVAALRRKTEEAEAAERAKARFLARMGHELRTPLNGVIGMTELLRDDLRGTATGRSAMGRIEAVAASAQQLSGLVDDVLEFTRLDEGAPPGEPEPFEPVAVLRAVATAYAVEARARGIEIAVAGDGSRAVVGDLVAFRRIARSLVENAVRYSDLGRVVAGWSEPGVLSVSDEGRGIPPEVLARIERPLETGDDSSSRADHGLGLGLPTVRSLVARCGGEMAIESVVGRGTTVRVTLPFCVAPLPEESAPAAPVASGRRILVAEDNDVNWLVAEGLLRRLGWTPERAPDGLIALERLRRERYDAVLMDWHMPGMDGLEVTRALRETDGPSRGARVVGLTASSMPGDEATCRSAGMDDFLTKPVRLDALERALRI